MRMILAHVESVHARGAGQILRLGPLLPLGLVAVVAGFSRGLEWRSTARRASAIALLAAGLLHLALFPEHLDEGLVIGLFFLASTVAEVLPAVLLVFRPSAAITRIVVAVATAVAMALGDRSPGRLAVAVTDGAVLAFLARGPWWATALALPAVAELLRTAARRTDVRIITPVGVTLLLGLELR